IVATGWGWPTPPLPGDWTGSIYFTPDGSTVLVSRGGKEGSAWLCRLNGLTGKELEELISGWGGRIAVAPGGKLAATGRTEKDLLGLGAGTVGLIGSPLGQGPLLAASALFPGSATENGETYIDLVD